MNINFELIDPLLCITISRPTLKLIKSVFLFHPEFDVHCNWGVDGIKLNNKLNTIFGRKFVSAAEGNFEN